MTNVTPIGRRDWRPAFLLTFRQTGNVLLACHAAGISRTQAYRQRAQSAGFAADWAAAEEDATDMLEAEARRRAMNSSDGLLMFLLRARRPSQYRDQPRLVVAAERTDAVHMVQDDAQTLPNLVPGDEPAIAQDRVRREVGTGLPPDAVPDSRIRR